MGAPLTLALAPNESPLAPEVSEPWTTADELVDCDGTGAVDLDSVCRVASEILFRLSGHKFGVRTETSRPYAGQRSCGWARFGSYDATTWLQRYQRNEGAPDWLLLKSPVQAMLSVKVDGATLDAS